jgi:hypothetical protein
MSNKLTGYLESQMQSLKLKGMLAHYQEVTEKASQNNLSYTEYLSLLFEEELKRKTEGTVKTKINKARFPFIKTLEEFDFSFQPSIREKEIIALGSLDFVEKKENIVFLGPPWGRQDPSLGGLRYKGMHGQISRSIYHGPEAFRRIAFERKRRQPSRQAAGLLPAQPFNHRRARLHARK